MIYSILDCRSDAVRGASSAAVTAIWGAASSALGLGPTAIGSRPRPRLMAASASLTTSPSARSSPAFVTAPAAVAAPALEMPELSPSRDPDEEAKRGSKRGAAAAPLPPAPFLQLAYCYLPLCWSFTLVRRLTLGSDLVRL